MSTGSTQGFERHRRYVFGYHYVATGLVSAYLAYGIYRLVTDFSAASIFTVVAGVGLGFIGYYAREFALRNQDRIIRLEERIRLAQLLPEDLRDMIDSLTTEQLIGLRFASDAELPELVRRVVTEDIWDREEIKKLIKHWRPDLQRI